MQENVPPSFGRRMKKILEVMVPILITQLAITGMNLADTIMSGHAGTAELAGVAIGANIWMPIFTGLNGILQALTPIVANYRGAKAYEKISGAVFSGLMLALILSVSIISVGILQLDKVLSLMNLESSVEVVSHNYLSYVAMGIVPLFGASILRSFVDTMGYTQLTMRLFLLTMPVNCFMNYLLSLESWDCPVWAALERVWERPLPAGCSFCPFLFWLRIWASFVVSASLIVQFFPSVTCESICAWGFPWVLQSSLKRASLAWNVFLYQGLGL